MTSAYDIAKYIMTMREDEIEDVLDQLHATWPETYAILAKQVQTNVTWHIGDE